MQTLSIIIPVYNEEHLIGSVLEKVVKADAPGFKKEIIVVDDGSTDKTFQNLKAQSSHLRQDYGGQAKFKITLIGLKKNMGKGAALKAGFKKATGDVLMVQDADEEYSTLDYPALTKPFLTDGTLVVYGSRNKKRENFHNRYSYFTFYLGGLALTWFINILYGIRLTDQPTGYKLFSSRIKHLLLKPSESRFSYEVAVTALLAKGKIRFIEIPIHYKPRTIKEGKKINMMDFIKSVIVGVKYKFVN